MQNQKSARAHEEGKKLFRQGKISAAERALKRALKLDPGRVDALTDLGSLYLKQERFRDALEAFRKADKLVSDHPGLINAIGNIYLLQGKFDKALQWLDRALALDARNDSSHCNRGSALRGLEDFTAAVSAYRRAIELNPRNAMYFINLAGTLVDAGELAEAIDCYAQALQLKPGDLQACLGLGKTWSALGNLEEAVGYYRQAIDFEPGNAKGYTGLACAYEDHGDTDSAVAVATEAIDKGVAAVRTYVVLTRNRRFAESDHIVAAMESLRDDKQTSDMDRSHLGFALGKVYEDLGEEEQAIDCILKAARLRRHQVDYSLSDFESRCDRIEATFSSNYLAAAADSGNDDQTPVFVLGMPRSGTTLVEQILASHSAVFGAGEVNDLPNVYQSLVQTRQPGAEDDFPAGVDALDAEDFAVMAGQYLERVRRLDPEAIRITDKLPHNFLRIGLIRLMFPKARIIHCTRDPMDNCFSLLKTDFQKGHLYSYDLGELGRYYRRYQKLMAHWKRVLPGFIFDVNYEALVQDQEQQTRGVLQYLDLPWEDACLDFHKTRRKIATASNAQATRPMYRDSIHRWERYKQYLQPLLAELQG